jgi:cellobiose phosphorylase
VRRLFRGATYNIDVENPLKCEWGVSEIWVDGVLVPAPAGLPAGSRERIIPEAPQGTVHDIRVVMGK